MYCSHSLKKFFIFIILIVYGSCVYPFAGTNRVHIHLMGADGVQVVPSGQQLIPFPRNGVAFGILTTSTDSLGVEGWDPDACNANPAAKPPTNTPLSFSIPYNDWASPCSALFAYSANTKDADDIIATITLSNNNNTVGSIALNELNDALNSIIYVYPGLDGLSVDLSQNINCSSGYTISGCQMNSAKDGPLTVQSDMYCYVSKCIATGSAK